MEKLQAVHFQGLTEVSIILSTTKAKFHPIEAYINLYNLTKLLWHHSCGGVLSNDQE